MFWPIEIISYSLKNTTIYGSPNSAIFCKQAAKHVSWRPCLVGLLNEICQLTWAILTRQKREIPFTVNRKKEICRLCK